MPYIKECRAPDLSEFRSSVASEYALRIVFQGAGTSDRRARSFVTNFILSVDKAIREYNAGRELLAPGSVAPGSAPGSGLYLTRRGHILLYDISFAA